MKKATKCSLVCKENYNICIQQHERNLLRKQLFLGLITHRTYSLFKAEYVHPCTVQKTLHFTLLVPQDRYAGTAHVFSVKQRSNTPRGRKSVGVGYPATRLLCCFVTPPFLAGGGRFPLLGQLNSYRCAHSRSFQPVSPALVETEQ